MKNVKKLIAKGTEISVKNKNNELQCINVYNYILKVF